MTYQTKYPTRDELRKITKTPQAVFDHVATHLMKQGVKSKSGYSCLYRGPEGTACAVGCLIPERTYDTRLEGRDAMAAVEKMKGDAGKLLGRYPDLLMGLQYLHDKGEPVTWPQALVRLARHHGLMLPQIVQDHL